MHELDPVNAADYLRSRGWVGRDQPVVVRELSGGVSNVVLRVDPTGRPPFVVKQCRERLRVAVEWLASLDRIWVEHAALRALAEVLPADVVPRVLFEDRDEYLFGMTCAPEGCETWKARLMQGDADPKVAADLGGYLATIHADAREHYALDPRLWSVELFDELRVDPYYQTTARAHPRLRIVFDSLIDAMLSLPAERRGLVLGDFSPKNILIHNDGLVLLDFECAHLGDPGFDLGFFLSHMILKQIHGVISEDSFAQLADAFLQTYFERLGTRLGPREEIESRGMLHAAACLLARVDGKSPVEYLDEPGRARARRSALELFEVNPQCWDDSRRVLEGLTRR